MPHHEEHEGQEQQVNPVQVQQYLGGIDYPTDKQTILQRAKDQGADDMTMRTLEKLPDQEYNSPNDISEHIGKSQ